MIVSFTGHRKIGAGYGSNPAKDYVISELESILKELRPEGCISGMAIGFDQVAALACIQLGIPFEAAIPFSGQEKRWPFDIQNEYNSILDKAVKKTIVCDGEYSAKKMQIRNEYMVDNSDTVVCCWDGSTGGTKNCLDYAKKMNKKIIRIDPNAYISVVQLDRTDLS